MNDTQELSAAREKALQRLIAKEPATPGNPAANANVSEPGVDQEEEKKT